MNRQQQIEMLKEMAKNWPEMIARKNIYTLTGGLYSPRTFANQDCLGSGVVGAVKIGKQVVYPKQHLIEWLISRIRG